MRTSIRMGEFFLLQIEKHGNEIRTGRVSRSTELSAISNYFSNPTSPDACIDFAAVKKTILADDENNQFSYACCTRRRDRAFHTVGRFDFRPNPYHSLDSNRRIIFRKDIFSHTLQTWVHVLFRSFDVNNIFVDDSHSGKRYSVRLFSCKCLRNTNVHAFSVLLNEQNV